ncbi:MAG TPA: BPTI/Kunitz domain-containing protein [Polyangiaceae bacterium]|jgi:hypothetical protein
MTKCAGGFALFALTTSFVFACGGRALNQAGSNAAATAGAGGASGAPPVGGGASGSVGEAGASAAPGACSLPEQPGNCDAYAPSFWHDAKTGLCEPFVYGGCGGNADRFATRDQCIAACPGGGQDWGACTHDSDCVTESVGCCTACEPVDDRQLLVFNSAHLDDADKARLQQCASVGACAPCPQASEYEATEKYFKPVCAAGQCSVIDIRQSALTTCQTNADCALRDGADCCPGYDGMGFVAVNKSADLCGGHPDSCPPPGPAPDPIPDGVTATCQLGHCALTPPTR